MSSTKKCSRCLAEFDLNQMPLGKPYRLGCKHKFCEGCFEEILLENKDQYLWCPLCRFKVNITELRETDPQMFSAGPKSIPQSPEVSSYLKTSQGNISVTSYSSPKSERSNSYSVDPMIISRSPRQGLVDGAQYLSNNANTTNKSPRKGSSGPKYATTSVNPEVYLSKSPSKFQTGHQRKASSSSGTGYITTEAYGSQISKNRSMAQSRDSDNAGFSRTIDEETPLFRNEINQWTMISDKDYLARIAEPRPNVMISVILCLLLVGMLPSLNLFRFYVVDDRFKHPLAVGMLTFATIFLGSSFYFLMRQRRVKRREKKRRKKIQKQNNLNNLNTNNFSKAPVLNINESVNDLFQGAGNINNTSGPSSNNNLNNIMQPLKSNNPPSDLFKMFQRIVFIFLTALIMILFFMVSWFSYAWNLCGGPPEISANKTQAYNTNVNYFSDNNDNNTSEESNGNLCAIVFSLNTVLLYVCSLVWKRERGSVLSLLACLVMAASVCLLFWEQPYQFVVKFNFKAVYLGLMLMEPVLFGIYFFVLRKAALLNNGSAKVLLVQSFFGLISLGALTIVFEGKEPWNNLSAGGLPLVCELIVFVMVLSAAIYFIPLICSYSDALTTGFFFQIGWILSDHRFLFPFVIYQTVQWSVPIILCLCGMLLALAYMTYRVFTIPGKWRQYHLVNKQNAEQESDDDSDIEID